MNTGYRTSLSALGCLVFGFSVPAEAVAAPDEAHFGREHIGRRVRHESGARGELVDTDRGGLIEVDVDQPAGGWPEDVCLTRPDGWTLEP